jgi:hypothetical protein
LIVWSLILFALAWLPAEEGFLPPQFVFPAWAVILFPFGWLNRADRERVWNRIVISWLVAAVYLLGLWVR